MLTLIHDLLSEDDFYGYSERIEIAKGKYKKPSTIKEIIKQEKRKWHLEK
tara:strand:+ start:13147 stop:13296 length:150 start_codon:yes stop_codon:yes gene_type:complete